jgi:hypothetical protein
VVSGAAISVLALLGSAQAQDRQTTTGNSHCAVWSALQGKCAKENPNTDDVLDHPNLYAGREATLEGRVDHIYSPTTFAMQDNYDLIGGDRILMISVMPAGAKSGATVTTGRDADTPTPAIELVQRLQNDFKEGKIIRATGTVRMFDRAALEQEFGTIDFGSTPLDKFNNQPVLLLGAREYAMFQQRKQAEQQAQVITPPPAPAPPPEAAPPPPAPVPPAPEPAPPAPEVQPTPEPAPAIAPEPEPPVQTQPTLPRTATPMPLIALTGLMALALGMGIRFSRTSRT